MTELLCEVCDREVFKNEFEYKEYISTLYKKKDRSLYMTCKVNNFNLVELD